MKLSHITISLLLFSLTVIATAQQQGGGGGGTGGGGTYTGTAPIVVTGTVISITNPLPAADGGTGVDNTATMTLGTSNINFATLGTGIVKNTTTTGALTDAASSDVITLWTGTCSSATFLRGDGSCQTPSGSGNVSNTGTPVSGQVALWTNSTTIQGLTQLTFSAPTLTVGLAGTSSGILALTGSTSGQATLTAPATAGTAANAVVSSNNLSAPSLVSTVATGTAPLTVTSTTNVANLNASSLNGATFANPGAIGGGAAAAGTFTALTATSLACGVTGTTACVITGSGNTSGTATITWPAVAGTATNPIVASNNLSAPALVSTVATGTAPLTVTSTTNVANLNASSLSGATFASPGAIGGGAASTGAFTTVTATTSFTATASGAGYFSCTQGSTASTGTTNITLQCPTAVTSYIDTLPGTVAQGLPAGVVSSTTRTENFTGSTAYTPAAITIGSGTSISATSLCSTTNCPAGNYDVAAYVEITTACTTTGSYIVWLGWTDDGSAKNGSSTTTFFPFPLNGSGVPTTPGTIVPDAVGNYATAHIFLHTTGAANNSLGSINYGTTAGACGTGTMVGKLFLTVTPLS